MPLAFLRRLPSLSRLFPPAQPSLAVEITDEHVAFARAGRGAPPSLAAWLVARLPAGAVKPSASAANLVSRDALAAALRPAREKLARGGPVALVLPDSLLRIGLVTMDSVPLRREEMRDLVAWRLKKTLPFRVEDATIDWQVLAGTDGRFTVLAAAARARIVAEYEQALEEAGFQAGSVTASTLALADLVPPGEGDRLLLNVGSGWFAILILRGDTPLFYRCKLIPESERSGPERGWFIAGEIAPTLEYHRARLGGERLSQAWLHVGGPGADGIRETLGNSLETPIETLVDLHSGGIPSEAAERLGSAWALACRGAAGEAARSAARRSA